MKSIKNQADVLQVFEINGWEPRNKIFDDLIKERTRNTCSISRRNASIIYNIKLFLMLEKRS